MISPYTKPEYIASFENYSKDITSLIAFAGSGCSYIPGIPTWVDFLKALNDLINAGVDAENISESGRLYEAASEIYNGNPHDFYKGISDLIAETTKTDFISMHSNIWASFDRVLTTNYDHCFEAAMDSHNAPLIKKGYNAYTFQFQELPNLDFDNFESTEKSLAYIHGRAGSENLVIRREDYQKYYPSFHPHEHPSPSNNLEVFLEKALGKFSFVFIGFSMDDDDFVRAFETFWEKNKELLRKNGSQPERKRKHFIFLLNDELKEWLNINDIRKVGLDVNTLIDKRILKYFPNDEERLIFLPNLEKAILKAGFNSEEKARIIGLKEKLEKNQKKLAQLEKLNICDIRVTSQNFNAISRFLKQTKPVGDSAEQINIQDIL